MTPVTPWCRDVAGLGNLLPISRAELDRLTVHTIPKGQVLFHAGDVATGFVVVLEGRIDVNLTSVGGRGILLYEVEPGQSCVQTTLGLMADEAYTGEALAVTDLRVVVIPRGLFQRMMDDDPGFRRFVMTAFGRRMQDVTRLLEKVAFESVDSRLAAALLELGRDGTVLATQADLAARIGSAREVISRKLDAFQRAGWVATDRGQVRILNVAALQNVMNVTTSQT